MRKHIKDKLLSIIDLIQEAHHQIKMSIRGGDLNTAISILTECQQSAIAIGNAIEESKVKATICYLAGGIVKLFINTAA